ncbi:MAG: type IX secretion system sortase PorU, partial [Candidatus Latescibacterota bacterium]
MRHTASIPGKLIPAFILGCLLIRGNVYADLKVTASHAGGIAISYRPESIQADSLPVSGKIYLRFSCDSHTGRGKPGSPFLPSRTVLVAVPKGSAPVIHVSALSRTLRKGVIVIPHPALVNDGNGFTNEVYREDPVRYAMSGFQPAEFVLLGDRHEFEDFTIYELTWCPVLFDAHDSTVAIADSIALTFSWNGQLNPTGYPDRVPEGVLNRETLIPPNAPKISKSPDDSSSPFASGEWYRVAVTDSGMFAITGSELSGAGFPAGNVRTDTIRMFYGGGKILDTEPHQITADQFREIAVRIRDVNGDGWFNPNDSIIFYGEALSRFILLPDSAAVVFQNHPYSRTNVYWLNVSGNGNPRRMESVDASPSSELPVRAAFREILHLERENSLEYPDSGIHWYWDGIKGASSKSFTFRAPGGVPGDSLQVRVRFINPSVDQNGYYYAYSHSLEIYVNDTGPFKLSIPGSKTGFIQALLPGALPEGSNLLKISRTGGASDGTINLDWFEIEYNRKLEYLTEGMEVWFPGKGEPEKYVLSGVSRPSLEIYDTTDPYKTTEYTGAAHDAAGRTVSFQANLPAQRYSRFFFCDAGSYRKVTSIARKNRSDLRNPRNGADYVIITPRTFLEESKKLADWRSRDSVIDPLRTAVIDVADIYDEFAWGVHDPTAIRDYLKYLKEDAEPSLRYCCLMGDTTFKYKNFNPKQTSKNWVPTFTDETVSTDDFFTWFDSTKQPGIAIGRFCVNSVEDAKTTISKTIEYERNPERGLWRNRMLLIADDELNENGVGQERIFTENIEDFDRRNYIPQSVERMKLLEIEYPLLNFRKPAATEELLRDFNEGCVMAHYIGHGNKDLLAHEHLLVGARDIERFNNAGRLPVFMVASCSVGSFDQIDFTSLAEILHLRAGGGCVAMIAASRPTFNSGNKDLSEEYYLHLFNSKVNPEVRIGLALQKAKQIYFDTDVYENFSDRYIIFGDPALRLAVPRYTVSTAPLDSLLRLQKVTVNGKVLDG